MTPVSKKLVVQLGSPLRVAILESLVRAAGAPTRESELIRETAALAEDVRGCLEPLAAAGWIERSDEAGERTWSVSAERSALLAHELAEASANLSHVLAGLRDAHDDAFRSLIGDGPRMRLVFEQARIASRTNVPVLLSGETGTGKELVAWAIHRLSNRAGQPFESVNAAAIPETLFEAEIFGYEKGAFTGARHKRNGRLVAAHGGTFFLDEIGELGLACQAKLLNVLQDRVVLPIGGTREVPTDFRLISATNRDLSKMAAEGQFREDLRYRLNVLEIRLPSLRERPEDVPALARHFLARASRHYGVPAAPDLTPDALQILTSARWPGNVRELENTIYRAALWADGRVIDQAAVRWAIDAPFAMQTAPRSKGRIQAASRRFRRLDAVIREAVLGAVDAHGGNLSAAARALDISRVTLYRKLREFGILADGATHGTDTEVGERR